MLGIGGRAVDDILAKTIDYELPNLKNFILCPLAVSGVVVMKVLFVDRDRDLVDMLAYWLKALGFEVRRAYDGAKARKEWSEQYPDLVIVDLALQDVNALDLCREMRRQHDALILIIAESKEMQDELRCLSTEADDYLLKPFHPSQLLAHIQAVSRRARATLQQRPSAVLTIGPIKVDARHNEVTVRGKTSRLTPSESKLLHLLASNVNNVCSTEKIISHIWGYNGGGAAYLIKAHIFRLRRKIEQDTANPRYIVTIPGVGYTLVHHADTVHGTETGFRSIS